MYCSWEGVHQKLPKASRKRCGRRTCKREWATSSLLKYGVYDSFFKDFHDIFGLALASPGLSNFFGVWNEECREIKVWRVKQFSAYVTCDQLQAILAQHALERKDASHILRQWHAHISFIEKKHWVYHLRKEMEMRTLQKNCSIIVDGASQSAYGLPHFATLTKDVIDCELEGRWIDFLES